ncbi:MAG: hypothetical protein WCC06_02200 [Candidatus Aminicenantales bacterium]
MNSSDIVTAIVIPLMLVFWGWVVWIILEWRKMGHKSKMQVKIVDKFTTPQELNDFLQSKEGDKFLNFLKFNGLSPKAKILSSMSKGVILFTLGMALVIIGQIFTEEMKFFNASGIFIAALGCGFLISTFISYKLSKKWGILDKESGS